MTAWSEVLARARAEAPRRYPRLPDKLRDKVKRIEPTQTIYRPVRVRLRTGGLRDAVYLCPAMPWFERWGVWPEQDAGKNGVPLEEVVDLEESPARLPREIAETIYGAGESGMGYHLFQLTFRDGAVTSFLTGGAVDFPDLPPGRSPRDIVAVTPHAGRYEPTLRRTLDYAWCLYSS